MASTPQTSVAPWKRELVGEVLENFEEYPVVGILDISGIPAPQFQEMRDILRGKAEIKVSRRVLLRIAIEKASEDEPELEELTSYLKGPSALIFTKMNPFKLWKFLKENRTSAPAKIGMKSPRDIVIPEGETNFSPGPVISELQQAGVKARIEAGKVVVREDSKIVEEGEPISPEVAGVLSRFDIEPREIGFELRAAYADGTVFPGDMLVVDEEETFRNIQTAYMNYLNLSFTVGFPTRQNVSMFLGQSYSRAYNLALNASVFTSRTMPHFLGRASSEMLGLASVLNSESPEAVGEKLSSMLSSEESAEEPKGKKEKPKEEAEEKSEEETEEEATAGLGGLFD